MLSLLLSFVILAVADSADPCLEIQKFPVSEDSKIVERCKNAKNVRAETKKVTRKKVKKKFNKN